MEQKKQAPEEGLNEQDKAFLDMLMERQYTGPEKEPEEINKNQNNMQKHNHKNYTFHNSTVTINEEGKAVEILNRKIENESRNNEMFMALAKSVVETLSNAAKDFMAKKAAEKTKAPEPVKAPVKKAPVKKAAVKKPAVKTPTKKK